MSHAGTRRDRDAAPSGTSIRSFVAIDVEPAVRAALGALQAELAAVRADVRWVRPDGLHVTLKFLGAVAPDRLDAVRAGLALALAGQPALRVRVGGLGAFPSWRRPRVVWVALAGDGLSALAARVEAALSALGFPAESRPFTPHLTLGRVNSPRGWPALEALLKAHLQDNFGGSRVDAVTLYRSTLQAGGAVYTPLWTIALEEHKGEPHDAGG
jgi:2'-5' RNA ligase